MNKKRGIEIMRGHPCAHAGLLHARALREERAPHGKQRSSDCFLHIACRRCHRCMMMRHIACERGHRWLVFGSVWPCIGSLCNQPQITKASQCMRPFTKFIMPCMRIFNLDNKQTGGSPRAS